MDFRICGCKLDGNEGNRKMELPTTKTKAPSRTKKGATKMSEIFSLIKRCCLMAAFFLCIELPPIAMQIANRSNRVTIKTIGLVLLFLLLFGDGVVYYYLLYKVFFIDGYKRL